MWDSHLQAGRIRSLNKPRLSGLLWFLALCAAALVVASPARSQTVEPIEQELNAFLTRGLGGTDVAVAENVRMGGVNFVRGDEPKQIYVTTRVLGITFKLPVFGQSDQVAPVMADVSSSVERACLATGGVLEKQPRPVATGDWTVQKVLKALGPAKPFGDFTCAAGDKVLFFIHVFAPATAIQSGIPGMASTWSVYVNLVPRSTFERAEQLKLTANSEADQLRAALSPSQSIAVRAADLPEAVRPKIPRNYADLLADNQYRVCGMVVDVKPQLVQVQIGAQTLFVRKDQIYPFRKAIAIEGRVMSDWDNWCVRN